MSRVILHCDCNAFYASVESVLNPEYKNVPMAVCGSVEDRHGIVLAKNELAKKYGIITAETVYSAKKKCPQLVIASPHFNEYLKYSRLINNIYAKYTDMIEPFGIDESWLDVTASQKLFGTGYEIAEQIKNEVKQKTGLTVSIGVSFNKVFAKLGSDYKKPDAITVIDEKNFKDIVFPLPVSDLLFVGKKTAETLCQFGIRNIGQLADADIEFLKLKFGKSGEMLYKYANGQDTSAVEPNKDDAKSIGNGMTFKHDLLSFDECRIGIDYLSEEIGRRLRKNSQICATVALTVKDPSLRTVQRRRSLEEPTDTAKTIAKAAYSILVDEWTEGKPIRMITVTASSLQRKIGSGIQISMFDQSNEKDSKREDAIDKIRQKYGNSSILSGAVIHSDMGFFESRDNEKERIDD